MGGMMGPVNEEMQGGIVRAMNGLTYSAEKYQNLKISTLCDVEKVLEGEGKIVIFGCGGHARSIVSVIRDFNAEIEIVLVDSNANKGEIILECKVKKEYEIGDHDAYLIGIGDNLKRSKLYGQKRTYGKGLCISVVSAWSCIGKDVQVGYGTFIASNTYLGPQAKVGNNTIINTGSVIEHEVIIGDNSHIAPNATVCGRAKIGNFVLCGAGSVVIDKIKVCDNVTIGAGAVVTKDIMEAGTYVGIPAGKIDEK